MDWAERERRIAEREKRLVIIELERREKTLQEREKWIIERNRIQKELDTILIILRGKQTPEEFKTNTAERERLEKEMYELERIEKGAIAKEKTIKELTEKLDKEKIQKDRELAELGRVDMGRALEEREKWLIHLEAAYQRLGNVTIRYVTVERVIPAPEEHRTVGAQTTHTRTVEEVGGERVTRDKDVTEITRVIKTVEYR